MPWVEPVILEGETLVLRPADLDDAPGLHAICPLETFRYYVTLQPRDRTLESFQDYLKARINAPNMVSYVVLMKETGQLIGETSFMDIREEARALEIGLTWYASEHKGTRVNPECKYLLLLHAFESLGAIRVTLKCDARNLHSQAAIRKLGATYEGTLRKHGIQPDGYVRDTAYFSILDAEWPEVRRGLLARLAT